MAATALSGGMPFDDSVGTAPPWLRMGSGPMSRPDGSGFSSGPTPNAPTYTGLASAMTGVPSPGSGTGSSALQPANSGAMPPSSNPILDSYMQNGGGATPGASNPAADAVMGAPVTPSMGTPQTGGSMNVPPPPAPSLGGTGGNPGVTLGSQSAFTGGPNVTTARVDYGGLPSVSTDFSGDAQRAADSAYKGATQYFDSDFTHANNDLENRLINQGFAPGTEGFTRQMELQQRGQDQARTGAALAAQQQGFQNAGDLLQRALAARQQGVSERTTDADRVFGQSMGIAGLGLGARGQDLGLQGAQAGASATMGAAGANASAANYRADLDAELQRRQLGLSQDNQDFSQMMALANLSQGSVPGLNFGPATPLDVGGAYNTSVAANNAAQNRNAANSNALYTLGGNLLGSYFRGAGA